jgi:hypothetical protein
MLPLFDRFDREDRLRAGIVPFFADAILGSPVFQLCGVALPEPVARAAQGLEWRALSCDSRPLDAHERRRIKFHANGCAGASDYRWAQPFVDFAPYLISQGLPCRAEIGGPSKPKGLHYFEPGAAGTCVAVVQTCRSAARVAVVQTFRSAVRVVVVQTFRSAVSGTSAAPGSLKACTTSSQVTRAVSAVVVQTFRSAVPSTPEAPSKPKARTTSYLVARD